jgi:hypothetical protein
MFLADTTEPVHALTAVVSTLDGVTTVLVAFVFFCMAYPDRVKNKPQFYAGFAAVAGIIVVHMLSLIVSSSAGFMTFCAVAVGALQLGAMVLFVLSVGGVSARELAGEMAKSYEVIRRGETQKEVIIPIGDQARKPAGGASPKVYTVPPAAKPAAGDEDHGLPLA